MHTLVSKVSFHLRVAGYTDIGRVRKVNEDAFVVVDLTAGAPLQASEARFEVGARGVLLAVSDGMGGADAGEVASAIVIDTLGREFAAAPAETADETLMNEAVQRAHVAVRDANTREGKKMGATLTAVLVRGSQAFIAEVGDSRAYVVRSGQIFQLTRDQSMLRILLDTGLVSKDDAERSPLKNQILQAMGHQPEVKVALARLDLRDRDCLVLCSDGLSGCVSDEEIRDLVLAAGRPEHVARQLVELANSRGGEDNITVVVAGVGGELASVRADEALTETFHVITTFEPTVSSASPRAAS